MKPPRLRWSIPVLLLVALAFAAEADWLWTAICLAVIVALVWRARQAAEPEEGPAAEGDEG